MLQTPSLAVSATPLRKMLAVSLESTGPLHVDSARTLPPFSPPLPLLTRGRYQQQTDQHQSRQPRPTNTRPTNIRLMSRFHAFNPNLTWSLTLTLALSVTRTQACGTDPRLHHLGRDP